MRDLETLQDMLSAGLDKLITMITVAFTKSTISKINRFCWLNYEPRVLSLPEPPGNHTKQDPSMLTLRRVRILNDGHALGQLLFGVLTD